MIPLKRAYELLHNIEVDGMMTTVEQVLMVVSRDQAGRLEWLEGYVKKLVYAVVAILLVLAITLVSIVILSSPARAESLWQKAARRTVAVAACAVSAYDGYQTATRIDGQHIREGNPLFANPNGTPRLRPMVSLKVGMCAAPILIGEWKHWTWEAIGLSGINLGISTGTVIHNNRIQPGGKR